MRFEISERIRTNKSAEEILAFLEAQFRKTSESVQRFGQTVEAKSIEASFGSINRADTSIISLRASEGGWLVIADVNYRPSVAFWIILIITLFTWVFWIIPIVFYLAQKNTVKAAIADCFARARNEFEQSAERGHRIEVRSSLEDLERLAALKEKGLITEEEFVGKKKQILGL